MRESQSFRSDQGEVWAGIEEMHSSFGTASNTCAMKDACEAQAESTRSYQEAFPCLAGQCGMVVLFERATYGFKFLS